MDDLYRDVVCVGGKFDGHVERALPCSRVVFEPPYPRPPEDCTTYTLTGEKDSEGRWIARYDVASR